MRFSCFIYSVDCSLLGCEVGRLSRDLLRFIMFVFDGCAQLAGFFVCYVLN